MVWKPPSETDFNERWVTPEDAIEFLSSFQSTYNRKRWIMERLKGALMGAVARTGQINPSIQAVEEFVPVLCGLWRHWDDEGDEHFWETGDAIFELPDSTGYGTRGIQRYFDVRFDPQGFSGKPPPVMPPAQEHPIASKSVAVAVPDEAKNVGGRPRKEFWEDMLIATFDQLWHGTATVQTQADIEAIMHSCFHQTAMMPASER